MKRNKRQGKRIKKIKWNERNNLKIDQRKKIKRIKQKSKSKRRQRKGKNKWKEKKRKNFTVKDGEKL